MSYRQLTEGKRDQIAALIAQGLRPSEVARIIHVHRSTIYRELRRNRVEKHTGSCFDTAAKAILCQVQGATRYDRLR